MEKYKKIRSRKFVRHSKKNWRKHCDITDIEEWQEDKRKEESSGFRPAVERTNEELFCIDDQPLADAIHYAKKRHLGPLKTECHMIPDPAIPPAMPPPTKKSTDKNTAMSSDGKDSNSSDDEDNGMNYRKRCERLASDVRRRKFAHIKKSIHASKLMDLWDNSPENTSIQVPNQMRYKVYKRPSTSKKSSSFQSLELPHAGMSYNPTYLDHQRLLKKALLVEQEKKKKEEKLKRNMKLAQMTNKDIERQWALEMSEGIVESEQDDSVDEQQDDNITMFKRPIQASNRKSRKQRRKERVARVTLKLKEKRKQERLRMDEVYRIRTIKKEIRKKEQTSKTKSLKREALKRKHELYSTKRLGKHVYEKPLLDLKLSSEIFGSLRLLQSEGNITRDRYKSIERRNMVAPKGQRVAARYQKNKPRVRWVEGRSYELRPDQMNV